MTRDVGSAESPVEPDPVLKRAVDQHGPDSREAYDYFLQPHERTPAREAAEIYREQCRSQQPRLA